MKFVQFMALTILQASKIRELYQQVVLAGNTDEIDIGELKDVISQYTNIKITVKEVDWGAHRFLGTIQRFDTHATIYVAAKGKKGDVGKITHCEQRFVIAKEMGHLVIDQPDNLTVHAVSLIKELCNPIVAKFDSHQPLQSEYVAEIFAIETLFPYQTRQPHLERIRRGEDTALSVATHFRIPEKRVEMALEKDYDNACREIYRLID